MDSTVFAVGGPWSMTVPLVSAICQKKFPLAPDLYALTILVILIVMSPSVREAVVR